MKQHNTKRRNHSKELIDSILNGSTEYAIIATDLNDKIILWNKGAELLYGYASEEMVEKQTPMALHQKATEGNDILFLSDNAFHGSIFDQEMKAIRKDGSLIPVSVTVTPRTNKKNEIIGFLIIVRDITNLKLSEKFRDILIETAHIVNSPLNIDEMCSNIINSINTLLDIPVSFICLFDKYSNKFHIKEQIGLTSSFCNHHCTYLFDDKDICPNIRNCFLSYSQLTINSGILSDHAILDFIESQEIKVSDYSIIHVPLLSDIALIGILHIVVPTERKNLFITETQILSLIANEISAGIQRKRLEEEIKQYADNLEKMVKERTHQLREKDTQLVQSGKLATLGEMATGIAHEINQPLGGISLMAQGLLMAKERGKLNDIMISEKLSAIIEQIERINRIITHLRTFARQPVDKQTKVNVNNPLLDVFKLVGEQLKNRNITVETSLLNDIPSVLADHNKLEQVFLNIIGNARDALDDFEKKVTEMKKQSEHPDWVNSWYKRIIIKTYRKGNFVFIDITDNAGGIPDSIIHKIFDPFFTTKEVGKGTGLGLSISYGIIKEFGGTIQVESEELVGSKFTVKLPSMSF